MPRKTTTATTRWSYVMQNIILYTSLTAEARYSITVSIRFRNVLALRVPGEHRACLGARAQSVTQGFFANNYPHTKLICYVCGCG